jgi:hypothetical protein
VIGFVVEEGLELTVEDEAILEGKKKRRLSIEWL